MIDDASREVEAGGREACLTKQSSQLDRHEMEAHGCSSTAEVECTAGSRRDAVVEQTLADRFPEAAVHAVENAATSVRSEKDGKILWKGTFVDCSWLVPPCCRLGLHGKLAYGHAAPSMHCGS